jgi:carbamoyltransferase
MKDVLNLKVKFREWYRPFAPVCRLEDKDLYFEEAPEAVYMSYAPKVKEEYRNVLKAITHIDNTSRLQTVTEKQHKLFYNILTELKNRNQIAVILNTSFNIRGKPILTTLQDALYVLDNTQLDYVTSNGFLFKKQL